jgi:hypothetical protein
MQLQISFLYKDVFTQENGDKDFGRRNGGVSGSG